MGPSDSIRKHLIGVVEDDEAVLNSLEFALQAEGYQVRPFLNAEEASRCPELLDADCVIVDYRLPGLDGVALLRKLRGRGMLCPAIVIASNPTAQCRKDALAVGAPLIEKPLIGHELSAQVHEMLQAARA